MLSLTRKPGQSIEIDGGIRIVVTGIESGHKVRLGIDAPTGVTILRSEVLHAITAKNRQSVASANMVEWLGAVPQPAAVPLEQLSPCGGVVAAESPAVPPAVSTVAGGADA